MAADIGTGLAMTWNSTAFAMELLSIAGDGEECPVIDVTHLGSSSSRTKMKGDLRDPGTFTAECHLDPDKVLRAGSTGTVSITIPWSTDTTKPTITGSAFISRFNYSMPLEDKMLCSYTFAWLTSPTFTAGTTT